MEAALNFFQNHLTLIVFSPIFLVQFIWLIWLQKNLLKIKKNQALIGGGKKNLEEIVVEQAKNLKVLDKDIHELYNISNQVNNLAFRGLHKVGMIRFNPFKDLGGDQSFAIAFLNGKNNGLVFSSLYTREGTRVFSKSVRGGKSEKHPLTEEEEEALKIAMSKEEKKI